VVSTQSTTQPDNWFFFFFFNRVDMHEELYIIFKKALHS
jgi:hypothetical protein